MRAENKPEPRPDEDILGPLVEKLKAFVWKNGLHVLLVAGVIVIAVLTVRVWQLHATARTLSQWATLGRLSQTPFLMLYPPDQAMEMRQAALAECSQILDSQKKTSATPWIRLEVANLLASGGQSTQAAKAYERIVEDYPQKPVAEMARQGLAVALEATGQYNQAGAVYERLAETGLARYLVDAGRCRELAGDVPAARAAYEKALGGDITADLRPLAEARLARLEAGQPLSPPPEPEPSEPASSVRPPVASLPADTPNATAPEEPESQAESAPAH